jgi:hypothetical protein
VAHESQLNFVHIARQRNQIDLLEPVLVRVRIARVIKPNASHRCSRYSTISAFDRDETESIRPNPRESL